VQGDGGHGPGAGGVLGHPEVDAHDVEGLARDLGQRQIGGQLVVQLHRLGLGRARGRLGAVSGGLGGPVRGRDARELRQIDQGNAEDHAGVALVARHHGQPAERHLPLVPGVAGRRRQTGQRPSQRLVGLRLGAGAVGGRLAVGGVLVTMARSHVYLASGL